MKRTIMGLALMTVSVLAFLQVTGMRYFGLSVWPVLLVLGGLSITLGSFAKMRWHGRPSWFGLTVGLWLGAIGLFDILKALGIVILSSAAAATMGWPLLLIALGLSVIFRRRGAHAAWHAHAHRGGPWGRGRFEGAFGAMGDLRYGPGPWKLDGDLRINHGFGDMKIDFSSAEITPGEHKIFLDLGAGEMLLKVPGNATVYAKAKAGMGEVRIFEEYRGGIGAQAESRMEVPDATVRLDIEASVGAGSIRIVAGPMPVIRLNAT
jgi:hypothetical protein